MIKFSIITVCLNAGQDLIGTVEKTLRQRHAQFEIIVKDGFSTDGSVEALPHDERIKLVRKKDGGIYDAMNQGIQTATGNYLIFMNAGDCFYREDVLQTLGRYIEQSPADLYYGRCYNESMGAFSNIPKKLTKFFCFRTMLCHQAMVFSRNCFTEQGYDLTYRVSADRELLMRLIVKEHRKEQSLPMVIALYKGAGFCESELSKQRIKEENSRMINTYYSRPEQGLYRFLLGLTLQNVRKKIVSNPKLSRTYKKLVGLVYGKKGVLP